MKALLSVSDKRGIASFAKMLTNLGYEILSTGGTLKELIKENIPATEVSYYTQSPEMFDGRIKTLHPKIHGGILYRRDNNQDRLDAQKNGILPIDIVCVNLYPFQETTQKTNDFTQIKENIDIGGPALLRAAAKNFESVLVITSPDDYESIIHALMHDGNTIEFRQKLMIKAFEHTAWYDSMIANYMNNRFNEGFGEHCFISGKKVTMTSYGENPHQKGAIYEFDHALSQNLKIIKGAISFNNCTDINQALKIISDFGDMPTVCIIKHGNPCGFAIKENILDSYKAALLCDPVSAYGGVLAINGILDATLAQEVYKHYIEVIIAGHITQEAQEIFATKKRIKLFELGGEKIKISRDRYNFKHIEGGFVFQEADYILDNEVFNAKQVSHKKATKQEFQDLNIAYHLAALVKSNCVVYVKDNIMVAIGMGMTSRVDAAKAAINKAKEHNLALQGAVLASEAFFPFRDSIDAAASVGISAIVQPGGSIRDKEVIQAANEHNIALYFSGRRHFYH